MYHRLIQRDVEEALQRFPVVALVGGRQTGKTTLAKQIAGRDRGRALYLDLELPSDLAKLADAQSFLSRVADKLVILDELHRVPEIFPLLRALIDRGRRPGRFLVLGSASMSLLQQASESLAGRVVFIELSALLLPEVLPGKRPDQRLWRRHWVRGGYPDSFDARDEPTSRAWRASYLSTFLERDVPSFGLRTPAAQLRRFWTMLSHAHGQLWNASAFSTNFGVSAPTVRSYVDLLTDLFVVRQLSPFAANVKKRLVKAPKVYVRDSGLLHSFLRIDDEDDLLGRPELGASFEGFAIEQILGMLGNGVDAGFYRTHTGVELDLVISTPKKRLAVEIKYSSAPRLTKGLVTAIADVGAGESWVVTAGEDRFPLSDGIEAIPLADFLREVILPLRRAARP